MVRTSMLKANGQLKVSLVDLWYFIEVEVNFEANVESFLFW